MTRPAFRPGSLIHAYLSGLAAGRIEVGEPTGDYQPTDQLSFALDSELDLPLDLDESPDIDWVGISAVDEGAETPGAGHPTDRSSIALDRTPDLPPKRVKGPAISASVKVLPAGAEPKVVIVDDDTVFLDEARRLFAGRVPTARTLAEVQPSVDESGVDLVLLGPSFAHEDRLQGVGALLESDPELVVVLVADTITAPLLRQAMRAGLKDVIEAPLTEQSVTDAIGQLDREPAPPSHGCMDRGDG